MHVWNSQQERYYETESLKGALRRRWDKECTWTGWADSTLNTARPYSVVDAACRLQQPSLHTLNTVLQCFSALCSRKILTMPGVDKAWRVCNSFLGACSNGDSIFNNFSLPHDLLCSHWSEAPSGSLKPGLPVCLPVPPRSPYNVAIPAFWVSTAWGLRNPGLPMVSLGRGQGRGKGEKRQLGWHGRNTTYKGWEEDVHGVNSRNSE